MQCCHFDFDTRFAPQSRAILSISSCGSGLKLKCLSCFVYTFWLRHTPFLDISTRKFGPDVGDVWGCFGCLTSKSASCHNGVHFFPLIPRNGSAPAALANIYTFRASGPQKVWRTQCSATSLPFNALWPCFYWLFPLDSFASLAALTTLAAFVRKLGSLFTSLLRQINPQKWG